MDIKELLDTLDLATSEVEWELPMNYAEALAKAKEIICEYDKLEKAYQKAKTDFNISLRVTSVYDRALDRACKLLAKDSCINEDGHCPHHMANMNEEFCFNCIKEKLLNEE